MRDYPAAACSQIFETSSLAFLIANGGTVSLNAWGLVTSHPKSSAGVSGTTISTLIFKPGARGLLPHMPGFLKLLWFVRRYVCVCPPQGH